MDEPETAFELLKGILDSLLVVEVFGGPHGFEVEIRMAGAALDNDLIVVV